MLGNIEERIVEMRFDNAHFEKNAAQSMRTLDKLDRSLQLTDGVSGLEQVGSALDVVSNRFSAMGIVADQVIRRVTDSVMGVIGSLGQMAKSLTVDQIGAGWGKYAQKTSAVQTIMAATAKDFTDTGEQMKFVNEQLDKLNWFTDETSYSFLDMVNNIGKFTSNGISLERSVTAMEGISTWAALSGANVGEASRAMYNLSQALAVGSVKLMDWKSIENANMATREFKETALETAVNLGKLTRNADGSYKTLQGHIFTIEQFNTQLSDGWFSSDVLMSTLDQYGSFSDELKKVSDATGYTATGILMALDDMKQGKEAPKELAPYLDKLASSEYDLGRKAFAAAQEAKTFQEAIDATKDAVSTGWMKTFEYLFGNYEEAKKLWTNVANELWDIFAAGGEHRNAVLKKWKESFNGYETMLSAVSTAWTAIRTILDTVSQAFIDVFTPWRNADNDITQAALKLINFTRSLKDLAKRFQDFADNNADKFLSVFKGLFSLFDIGRMAIVALFKEVSKLFPTFQKLGGNIFDAAANLGDWISNLRDAIKENKTFENAFSNITSVIKPMIDWIRSAAAAVRDFIRTILGVEEGASVWTTVGAALSTVAGWISTAFTKISAALKTVFSGERGSENFIKTIGGLLAAFLGFKKIQGMDFGKGGPLGSLLEVLKGGIDDVLKKFSDVLDGVKGALKSFTNETNSKALKNIAIAIAILAASIVVMAAVDPNKLGVALLALTTALGELIGSLKLLNGLDAKLKAQAITSLIKLAAAVLILAIAMKVLDGMELASIGKGLLAITVIMGLLFGLMFAMDRLKIKSRTIKGFISMAIAVGILSAVVVALGKQDLAVIGKGLLALTGIIVLLAGSMFVLGKFASGGKMLAAGAAMIAMALAIVVLVAAIALLSMIQPEKLMQGFVAFLAILIFSVAAIAALSAAGPKAIASAAALLVLSVAIVAMTAALAVLGYMGKDQFEQGIVGMMGLLVLMVTAVAALGAVGPMALVGAAAMLILSAAVVIAAAGLLILSVALAALEGRPIAEIAGGLAVLGLALVVLGIGCVAMSLGVIGAAGLIALAFAMNLLSGLDLAGMAGGMALLGLAMIPLAIGSVSLGVAAVPMLAASVAMAAMGIALIPFAYGLKQLDGVRWQALVKYLGALGGTAVVIAALTPVLGPLAIALAAFGAAALGAGEGINLAGTGMQKIVDSILKIPDDAATKLKEMAKTMAAALRETGGDVTDEMRAIMQACFEVVSSYHESFVSVGEYISAGIATGVARGAYRPIQTMDRLATTMQDRFATRMEIKSPSRVMERLAGFIPKGAAIGVTENMGLAADAMGQMGDQMITAISPALAIIAGLLNGEFDIDPTIRPIVDLSDVSASASSISGMFAGAQTVSVSTAQSVNRRMNTSSTTESVPENQNGNSVQPAFAPVINVYPDPGMDEDALADKVINRMQDVYTRRGVALG